MRGIHLYRRRNKIEHMDNEKPKNEYTGFFQHLIQNQYVFAWNGMGIHDGSKFGRPSNRRKITHAGQQSRNKLKRKIYDERL